jgi:hypothetical protein
MNEVYNLADAHAAKEAVLDVFEITQADYLVRARDVARGHAIAHGTVTIDDVRRLLPLPEHISPNVLGAIFRNHIKWERTATEPSSRKSSHARLIGRYRLRATS